MATENGTTIPENPAAAAGATEETLSKGKGKALATEETPVQGTAMDEDDDDEDEDEDPEVSLTFLPVLPSSI